MVEDHPDSEKESPLSPHRLLFTINSTMSERPYHGATSRSPYSSYKTNINLNTTFIHITIVDIVAINKDLLQRFINRLINSLDMELWFKIVLYLPVQGVC